MLMQCLLIAPYDKVAVRYSKYVISSATEPDDNSHGLSLKIRYPVSSFTKQNEFFLATSSKLCSQQEYGQLIFLSSFSTTEVFLPVISNTATSLCGFSVITISNRTLSISMPAV